MLKLSERLQALRKEHHLSQEKFAVEVGIGFTTYRRDENGKREPTASVLVPIADFYGVSLDYLVGRSGHREVIL